MRRVDLLGCRVDALAMDETVARCARAIQDREGIQHVCVNAAKIVQLHRNPRLAEIIRSCELVSADGQSVVWASRVLGVPLPERVAGIDLMHALLALARAKGLGVYFLGAAEEVLAQACERLAEAYPGLRIVGRRNGYFRDEENQAICAEIRAAAPDILFVAMPSPKKEYWLAEFGPELGVPVSMGVGGSIDVVAGITARAPGWAQRAGLEWAFRLLQEPRRLAGRYAKTNTRFLWLVGRELARRAAAPPQEAVGR